jgi:hypothetical protein
MKTLNAEGINALADWLLDNHYRGAQIVCDGHIDAWAKAVESDPDHLIEIPARASVTGAPVTMRFEPHHFQGEAE